MVDAEIVPDGDADAVWQQILTVGGQRGMKLGDILDDFPAQMGGLLSDSATAGELQVYLDQLQAREDVPA